LLARLEQQLRLSPKETLLADIVRAEGLAAQLEDAQPYPEEFVIFRITGYRPTMAGEPQLITGVDLKNELSAFVERLCDAGKVTIDDFDAAQLIDADELCTLWNMSRRTLVRMRKRGLVGRRLLAPDGKPRVMFDRGAVRAFEAAHSDQIERAADYSRISPEDEANIIKRASRYKKYLGWSLNMAAERIAERFDRSHEAIRQVLKRYESKAREANERSRAGLTLDAEPPPPLIFNEAQPLTLQRREVVFRAWRLGIDPNLMSVKFRRSRPALRRAVSVARSQRLLEWAQDGFLGDAPQHAELSPLDVTLPPGLATPTDHKFDHIGNVAHALSAAILNGSIGPRGRAMRPADPLDAAPVVTGLARAVPRTISLFLAQARATPPIVAVEEKARLDAYFHLRAYALKEIFALHRLFPRTTALDSIETHLRWAARLKLELIRAHLRSLIETVEGRAQRPMEDLPRTSMPKMLVQGAQQIGEAIDAFDPSRGGRLAASVGLAMDKHAIRWLKELKPIVVVGKLRASPLLPNTYDLPDWSLLVCAWQRWLEPHPRVRLATGSPVFDGVMATFLRRRFGWDGAPPHTLAQLAQEFNFTPVRTAIFEQRSLHAAVKLQDLPPAEQTVAVARSLPTGGPGVATPVRPPA